MAGWRVVASGVSKAQNVLHAKLLRWADRQGDWLRKCACNKQNTHNWRQRRDQHKTPRTLQPAQTKQHTADNHMRRGNVQCTSLEHRAVYASTYCLTLRVRAACLSKQPYTEMCRARSAQSRAVHQIQSHVEPLITFQMALTKPRAYSRDRASDRSRHDLPRYMARRHVAVSGVSNFQNAPRAAQLGWTPRRGDWLREGACNKQNFHKMEPAPRPAHDANAITARTDQATACWQLYAQ